MPADDRRHRITGSGDRVAEDARSRRRLQRRRRATFARRQRDTGLRTRGRPRLRSSTTPHLPGVHRCRAASGAGQSHLRPLAAVPTGGRSVVPSAWRRIRFAGVVVAVPPSGPPDSASCPARRADLRSVQGVPGVELDSGGQESPPAVGPGLRRMEAVVVCIEPDASREHRRGRPVGIRGDGGDAARAHGQRHRGPGPFSTRSPEAEGGAGPGGRTASAGRGGLQGLKHVMDQVVGVLEPHREPQQRGVDGEW